MIIKEIYEFDYELFLAEQELYESMIDYGSVVTRESYGLFLLNEGVKETIMGYLTRVSGSITKVWNNLKDYIKKYRDERDGEFLKEIAPKINDFFNENMVMVDDEATRRNRLRFLGLLSEIILDLADFTSLIVK